jgi:hypothetical protein
MSDAVRRSPLKNPYLYSTLIVLAVLLYVGYILYSRAQSNRSFEQHREENQREAQRNEDRQAIEQLGGSDLAVRSLYVSPAIIRRGDTAQLCYDVSNAKTVTLNPPSSEEVWPSHSRCVKISPRKTTTYTMTITDAAGKTVSQDVELRVQ